jgi:hypothetical protein
VFPSERRREIDIYICKASREREREEQFSNDKLLNMNDELAHKEK